jgi:hypothetical protein
LLILSLSFETALAGELPEPFRELQIAVVAMDPAARPTAAAVRGLLENARKTT